MPCREIVPLSWTCRSSCACVLKTALSAGLLAMQGLTKYVHSVSNAHGGCTVVPMYTLLQAQDHTHRIQSQSP